MFKLKLIFTAVFIVLFSGLSSAELKLKEKDKNQILQLFDKQVSAWNDGNLEEFMQTYWKSEKLVFVGSRGPSYGWVATLESYKKGYPDKKAMGKLEFDIL